jgi:uncharacterized membrane protein
MRLSERFKRSFVAGLVLVAPLVVTVVVLRVVFSWLLVVADPLVTETRLAQYTGNVEFAAQALAIVVLVVAVTALGYVAQRGFGSRVFANLGRVMDFVPLVSVSYGSVRQVANSLVDGTSGYERVVLVEYAREDLYVIGSSRGRPTGQPWRRPANPSTTSSCRTARTPPLAGWYWSPRANSTRPG